MRQIHKNMAETRDSIIELADQLIRDKGYNAFSFKDISNTIGIKTASIHYHFPAKSDLGVAVIREHKQRIERFKDELAGKTPAEKIKRFLGIYVAINAENRICLVGSLGSDFNTIDPLIQNELKRFAGLVLELLTGILEEGKKKKVFAFETPARTKALLIITSITAAIPLSRLTGRTDFDTVRKTIMDDLKPKKQ